MPSALGYLHRNVVSSVSLCAYGDIMTFIGVGFLAGFGRLSDKVSDKLSDKKP